MDCETTDIPAQFSEDPSIARLLRSASLCRTRDLGRLMVLCELVRASGELIHALQKERGASSIFLGSGGAQFAERLDARVAECRILERTVRDRLEHIDERLDRMSCGARFYTRVALALRALGSLPDLRAQIRALQPPPLDSVKSFTDIIGALLAVGYEVGDIAADPEVSRAVVALVNFAQAKEYAGQERATAGAAISLGRFDAADLQRLEHLMAAQQHTFGIFADFAAQAFIDALNETLNSRDSAAVERLRRIARDAMPSEPAGISADAWYQHTTGRIDGLRVIEAQMSEELGRLCALKLSESRDDGTDPEIAHADTVPIAVLFDPGVAEDIALYGVSPGAPRPIRSILNVVAAQSRRISDVSAQLETARAALSERKLIDRAKGVLMESRGISEKSAYALMRETAMKQNKRMAQIAEAILSTAAILKA